MKLHAWLSRGIPVLLLASLSLPAVASVAQARDNGVAWGRRYKDARGGSGGGYYGGYGSSYGSCGSYGSYGSYGRRVIVRHESSAGPAIAGFIGGLVVGTVLNNHSTYCPPPVVHERVIVRDSYRPAYDYYDPYCRESFSTLDAYYRHASCHHHPMVARVIDVRSGECVDTCCYRDGRWSSGYGPDYACRGDDGRYGDGGRYDDRGDDDWDN